WLALPDDCGLVLASGLHMTIQAVVGKVQFPTQKPLRPRMLPLENFVPFFKPVQFIGNASPELLRLVDRFAVNALVVFRALDVRASAELFGWLKPALLLKNRINVGGRHRGLVGHGYPSVYEFRQLPHFMRFSAGGLTALCGSSL